MSDLVCMGIIGFRFPQQPAGAAGGRASNTVGNVPREMRPVCRPQPSPSPSPFSCWAPLTYDIRTYEGRVPKLNYLQANFKSIRWSGGRGRRKVQNLVDVIYKQPPCAQFQNYDRCTIWRRKISIFRGCTRACLRGEPLLHGEQSQ